MSQLGVNAAIIQEDKILLVKREDFHVWCLPGGEVEEGESLTQAAMREAREETGLEVRLTRLVGIYSRSGWLGEMLHVPVFAAEVIGGELKVQESEVLEARFFGRDELPGHMLMGHIQRALDALDGVCGAVWMFDADQTGAPVASRQELYARRDQSGLPPEEFYERYVGKTKPGGEHLEVQGEQYHDLARK
jgi:ADP-ribose pyrophosphatase YjhB (NUDIX family)